MSYDYPDPARPPARPPRPLVGTPRQVDWATRIYGELADRVGQDALPDILEARFWIDVRECGTASQIAEAARAFLATFESPFTDRFPRFSEAEAHAALDGLRRLAATVGVAVLDLETTGLERTDRVVEIAAIQWPSREVLIDTVVGLPPGFVPAEVSGIPTDEWWSAPMFEEHAERVSRWAATQHLVTWNVRFDIPVLRRELSRANRGLVAPAVRATCAMRLSAAALGLDGWPSLAEVAERLGIETTEPAHRAMADVLTTCSILDALAGRIP